MEMYPLLNIGLVGLLDLVGGEVVGVGDVSGHEFSESVDFSGSGLLI